MDESAKCKFINKGVSKMTVSINQQIKTCSPEQKMTIDIDGPEGNVFSLMAIVKKLGDRLGLESKSIMTEMQEDDYAHALRVFNKNFGEYVNLETQFEYNLDEVE